MKAKALKGGLWAVLCSVVSIACLMPTDAAAWNTVGDASQFMNEQENSHLYIVNRALDLLATRVPGDPVAAAAIARMRTTPCNNRWMKGLNDADNSSAYADNGSPNGAEGTHFWNSGHQWPYDNHFNARSANRYHHDNAREQADKYIGRWRDSDDCYWLGLALHYVTDLSQPMHVANVIGIDHAAIEEDIARRFHSRWVDSGRYDPSTGTGSTLSGTPIWPPQSYDTASWALTQVTFEVWNEAATASPYGLSWWGDRYFPLSITLSHAREALEDAQPWAARYIYGLFNRDFAVGSFYRSDSRYERMIPGGHPYDWDWAVNHYKAVCPFGQPMTGISKSIWLNYSEYNAYMARNVQCRNDNPGKFTPISCRVKVANQGENQASTMTPASDWAYGYWKTTCESNEYVFGISQTTTGNLASILCCSAANLSANVANAVGHNMVVADAVEPGSQVSLGHDWSWGDWKGECGPGRYIIGVARVPTGVAHVGFILCVN